MVVWRATYATGEDQVAHDTSGAVLHEDTLVLVARRGGHGDSDVDERSRLSDLPMETSRSGRGRDGGQVDVEVADGS